MGTEAVRDVSGPHEATSARDLMSHQLAIIEFCRDAITSSTLDGIYTSWNPAAEKLYGYP